MTISTSLWSEIFVSVTFVCRTKLGSFVRNRSKMLLNLVGELMYYESRFLSINDKRAWVHLEFSMFKVGA